MLNSVTYCYPVLTSVTRDTIVTTVTLVLQLLLMLLVLVLLEVTLFKSVRIQKGKLI